MAGKGRERRGLKGGVSGGVGEGKGAVLPRQGECSSSLMLICHSSHPQPLRCR
jgi:hypothetical protein